MTTDYEAVYESVMQYSRNKVDTIDSQEKLRKFLLMNDRQNRLSFVLIDKLLQTRNAEHDIKKAQEGRESLEVIESRQNSAIQNKKREEEAKNIIIASGKQPVGTHTLKSGVRVVLIKNSSQIDVYELTDKRGRKTLRNPATGRIMKK